MTFEILFLMSKTTKIIIVTAVVVLVVAAFIAIVSFKSARNPHASPEAMTGLSPIGLKATFDIQPDNTILAQCTVDETNNTSRTISVDNINDVNIGDVRRVVDESGNPLKISRRPQGGILVTLSRPVPPGGTVSFTGEFRMPNFFKKDFGGYELSTPVGGIGNFTEAHIVYVWRLPPGATLLGKNETIEADTNAGQIELTFDRMIPPNGTFPVEFRYRSAVAAN